MKIKRHISILLVFASLFTLLVACGGKEDGDSSAEEVKTEEMSINPELIAAFGEDMIEDEKETIAALVGALKECYEQHQKDKDVYAFISNVDNAMQPYKGYLKEISDELMNMYETAKIQGDKDKMMELLSVYSSSIAYVADENTWSNYKFFLDNGMNPISTEQEAEEAVIEYINDISAFFYCTPIAN